MGSRSKMQAFFEEEKTKSLSAAARYARQLLDPDSFVEFGARASSAAHKSFPRAAVPGDGIICGYGSLHAWPVYLAVQDSEVYKGAVGPVHAEKFIVTVQRARENGAALIIVLDSGGVRAEEGLEALAALGRMNMALQEARGEIPLIMIVKGACTGALSLLTTAVDLLIVAEEAGIYLQGPGVTAAMEDSAQAPAEIGGARVHTEVTGLADIYLAEEDIPAFLQRLAAYFAAPEADYVWSDDPNRASAALNDLAAEMDAGYDIKTLTEAVFDSASILPIREAMAPELYAGLARIGDCPLAFVATSGAALGRQAGQKISRICRLAESLSIPLLSFTDSIGFIAGSKAEKDGMVAVAGEILAAFANLDVPRINIYTGMAYGSFAMAFNSKSIGCELCLAWPTAEIGLLTADQQLSLFGEEDLAKLSDPIKERPELLERYKDEYASPVHASALGQVDEIILPGSTRPRIYSAMQQLGYAN